MSSCNQGVNASEEDVSSASCVAPSSDSEPDCSLIDSASSESEFGQNGYVDEEELQLMFKNMGVHLTLEETEKAFIEMDESQDGEISYEELIEWLMKKEFWDPEVAEQARAANPSMVSGALLLL